VNVHSVAKNYHDDVLDIKSFTGPMVVVDVDTGHDADWIRFHQEDMVSSEKERTASL
jgi:hypothetical protein